MSVQSLLLFMLALSNAAPSDGNQAIALVRDGRPSLNSGRTIAETLAKNHWYPVVHWSAKVAGTGYRVCMQADLDDIKAVADYFENERYSYEVNVKSIQLQPLYGLLENRPTRYLEYRRLIKSTHRNILQRLTTSAQPVVSNLVENS